MISFVFLLTLWIFRSETKLFSARRIKTSVFSYKYKNEMVIPNLNGNKNSINKHVFQI